MSRRSLLPGWMCLAALFGLLLVGRDCAAQTDPCTPDPCQGIAHAVTGTCTPVGGSCTPAADFSCECDAGFAWQDSTNACEGLPPADMVSVPAGCFDMGDAFSEGHWDERPVHNVCISAFSMDIHEVTNAEYAACVDDGACTAPEYPSSFSRTSYYGNAAYDDFPVIWVDWYQATAYCTWAGKRLPTEAEWEYAARGGLAGKRYPWGDSISGSNANYQNSGDPWDNDTSRVKYYAANNYGLYDTAGNVWEWVNDWYQDDYYEESPTQDPPGPPSGTYKVFRGGSWEDTTYFVRVAERYILAPGFGYPSVGFRCAWPPR